MERRILVVDDSELICQQLSQLLALPDRQIAFATDGTAALEWLVEHSCSLVLTDLRLPGISGLDLIKEIRKKDLPVTVIVMTGFATIEDTVEAIKLGAYDLVQKPLDTVGLELLVHHALEDRRLIDEVADLRCRLQRKSAYHNLLGQSPGMTEVFERVARVGSSSCTVLITGETGTGKELVAQAIHFSDVTRRGPLVAVNCAALPEHLLESELFGHERGAFTGADRQKKGRFELAQGGTLFLDEIGEMPLGMQAKLLRVLQDGRFERVGGTEAIQTDCRVIAATNVILAEAVAAGRFREDLFYRLNVVSIEMPPLRERLEDIPLLVNHFLDKMAEKGLPIKTLSRAGSLAAHELRLAGQRARARARPRAGNRHHRRALDRAGKPAPADRRPPRRTVPSRIRPPPAASRDHRRFHQPDRARLSAAGPRKIPRPCRVVRATLRPLAAQHQRETPPLPDRQARLQAAPVAQKTCRSG